MCELKKHMEPNKDQENSKGKAKPTEDKNKTPVKRTKWSATEEKQFLILCRDKAIAEMLDNTCLTTVCVSMIFFRLFYTFTEFLSF